MNEHEAALFALLTIKRAEVKALEQAVAALGLNDTPVRKAIRRVSSKGHPFGNGEPDAELAAAAGINLQRGAPRPDKWRQYLSMRRKGIPFWKAATKLNVHKTTAQRLEALV